LSVFGITSVFFRECFLALCMFMRRGASALRTAKPAVLLSDVATPRAGPWLVGHV
jgi:murein endopeptidase